MQGGGVLSTLENQGGEDGFTRIILLARN